MVPECTYTKSNNVVESLAALVELTLMIIGCEKLKSEDEVTVVKSIEMTIPPDRDATPELDLQRKLLPESHDEYWAAVSNNLIAGDDEYSPNCKAVRVVI